MRMFLYYAVHSFWNQLRKMFKSWVLAFIAICFVVGIIIGLVAATISKVADKQKEETEVVEMVDGEQEESQEEPTPDSPMTIMLRDEIGYPSFIELIVGAVVILIFVLAAVNADKNAGKIFLPADVTLLFPSPLKPQSVMMFRIANQLGQMILISLYLMFQVPNLVLNVGLSLWGAIALVVAYCVTNFLSTLLQLLLYLIGSLSEKAHKLIRPGLIACLSVIAGGFLYYQKTSGKEMLPAAAAFFNAPGSEYIPFWGWMKGFCRAAIDGDLARTMLFLGLLIVGTAILIFIIWRLKVDFYEDAMAKSEEVAELMQAARESRNGITMSVKRKKDRSDKLKRDGMSHGKGANVFFFKNMYNRFRFAHFGFFTKTMETYLLTAVAVGIIFRKTQETPNPLILVAVLAGFVFFRSLGNPLEEDTQLHYFILMPEGTWAKLFFSLLAGITNTALDLLLPVIVGSLIMGANPLIPICLIPVILSVDVYSTTVGAFIGLSLPQNAGAPIKTFVQILFIYFGLLPDIFVLTVLAILGHVYLGIAAVAVVNLLLGLIFFALAAHWLSPRGGTPEAIL